MCTDIESLVDSATDLDVRLSTTGAIDSVPSGVGTSAFRVVQEALTNARRHAGPNATIDVRVDRTDDRLDICIEDDGRGASADHAAARLRTDRYGRARRRLRRHVALGPPAALRRLAGSSELPAAGRPAARSLALARSLSGRMIRVLLVDDQAMIRQGLRMILDAEPGLTIVGEAADGFEAVALVPAAKPDVVLMDVRMPKLDGIAACARICAAADPPRVLMLTTFDLEDYVYSALRAGASGFLLKDAPAEQLVEAIEVVARGDAQLAPQITRLLIEEVAKRPTVDRAAHPWVGELTDRESEVLRLMSRGRSNAEIAADLYLGEATVKTLRRTSPRQARRPGSGTGGGDGLRVRRRRARAHMIRRPEPGHYDSARTKGEID